MTYFHICEKCGKQFLTGERGDFKCVSCLGLFPPLTYYDLTEVDKERDLKSLRYLQKRYSEIDKE